MDDPAHFRLGILLLLILSGSGKSSIKDIPRKCCPFNEVLNEAFECVSKKTDGIIPESRPILVPNQFEHGLPICSGQVRRVRLQSMDLFKENDLDVTNMCLDFQTDLKMTVLLWCDEHDDPPPIGTLAKCCDQDKIFDEVSNSCIKGKKSQRIREAILPVIDSYPIECVVFYRSLQCFHVALVLETWDDRDDPWASV